MRTLETLTIEEVVPDPDQAIPEEAIVVEQAASDDAGDIARVLRSNAHVRTLILQPPSRIERHLDEFVVVRGPDRTLHGCAQLRWHRPRIAEVTSVAVLPSRQGDGLGQALVRGCIERAAPRDPQLVWLATATPEWFERLGFERMAMWDVPLPVLLRRLPSVFHQPRSRWLGALTGPHCFMRWTGSW